MVRSAHHHHAGFLTGEKLTSPRGERTVSTHALMTWNGGYEQALHEADQRLRQGIDVVLVRLASQPWPSDAICSEMRARHLTLVTVSNRFGEGACSEQDLIVAVRRALDQHGHRLPLVGHQEAADAARTNTPDRTTASNLTDDAKRELLAAVYGDTDDDGVR